MIWLVGAGNMARVYIDVLSAQDMQFQVIGRSVANAEKLAEEKNVHVVAGGIESFLQSKPDVCQHAIVAVDVDDLCAVTTLLLSYGVKTVLLEKPGGIDFKEIRQLEQLANEKQAKVFIAYNRRYYASVIEAINLIECDGGIESFHFEFTEWADSIGGLPKSLQCKKNWLMANSSHVIDMAFFIGGFPQSMASFSSGANQLDWHPSAVKFTGAGISTKGATFSYCANWNAPGRWSLEFMTRENRYIFRPMEKLAVQKRNTVVQDWVDVDYAVEESFKPGLYNQVKDFLDSRPSKLLLTLSQQAGKEKLYNTIIHGGAL